MNLFSRFFKKQTEKAQSTDSRPSPSMTFAQLNIPFKLFEGPADHASEYCGLTTCSLCGKQQHSFEMGIGCRIIIKCSTCGTENGLDAADRENGTCHKCDSNVPFPNFDDEQIKVCYDCLRAGKAAITKGTELGMISWEHAIEGMTHGLPGLNHPDFEMVSGESDWIRARLPQDVMLEMLRTPTYSSIQGEEWQFCCKQPMVFIGEWSREEFSRRAQDGDGQRFFEQIVQSPVPGLWEDRLHDITGVYVFRCPLCERVTAHWDLA
jgi:uncharacterized protein CbrC (UPF0167 family)